MGNDETDPPDHAGNRHRRRRQQRRAQDEDRTQTLDVHAHGGSLLVAERHGVELPAHGRKRKRADEKGRHEHEHVLERHGGQAAHQSVGDLGKLAFGVGDVLRQRDERGEQRRHDHAAENEHQNGVFTAADALADEVRDTDRRDAEHEGVQLDEHVGKRQQDGDGGAEARAG